MFYHKIENQQEIYEEEANDLWASTTNPVLESEQAGWR